MKKIFFLLVVFFSFCIPVVAFAQVETGAPPVQEDDFYKAKVVTVLKEGETEEYGRKNILQNVKLEFLQGPEKGKQIEIPYEIDIDKANQKLKIGDKIIVGVSHQNADLPYYVSDMYRVNALWMIFAFFFALTLVLSGKQGFRSFIGLVLSFVIIMFFIVPLILKGWNPLLVSAVGALGIVSTTLYIAHGFHARTTVAFVSMLLTIGLSVVFSLLFVFGAKLFGLGTEEAFFLQTTQGLSIDLRGLLLGGILIGTLGVLDDIATAQAATVEQIHRANTSLSFKELYQRGSEVGKEHIASLVNTLVLAYTGASFPLLLLFSLYQKPMWTTLNSEVIAEEVVRMLVGSIALICAVPITTFLSAYLFSYNKEKLDSRN